MSSTPIRQQPAPEKLARAYVRDDDLNRLENKLAGKRRLPGRLVPAGAVGQHKWGWVAVEIFDHLTQFLDSKDMLGEEVRLCLVDTKVQGSVVTRIGGVAHVSLSLSFVERLMYEASILISAEPVAKLFGLPVEVIVTRYDKEAGPPTATVWHDQTPLHLECAMPLASVAIFCLLAHEVGHVARGHLAIEDAISERGDGSEIDITTAKALEMDADSFSTWWLLEFVRERGWPGRHLYNGPSEKVLSFFFAGTYHLFWTFDDGRPVRAGWRDECARHPPVQVRVLMAVYIFAAWQSFHRQPQTPDLWSEVVYEIELASVLLGRPSEEWVLAVANPGGEEDLQKNRAAFDEQQRLFGEEVHQHRTMMLARLKELSSALKPWRSESASTASHTRP